MLLTLLNTVPKSSKQSVLRVGILTHNFSYIYFAKK